VGGSEAARPPHAGKDRPGSSMHPAPTHDILALKLLDSSRSDNDGADLVPARSCEASGFSHVLCI
jgi:hypothetical protein